MPTSPPARYQVFIPQALAEPKPQSPDGLAEDRYGALSAEDFARHFPHLDLRQCLCAKVINNKWQTRRLTAADLTPQGAWLPKIYQALLRANPNPEPQPPRPLRAPEQLAVPDLYNLLLLAAMFYDHLEYGSSAETEIQQELGEIAWEYGLRTEDLEVPA